MFDSLDDDYERMCPSRLDRLITDEVDEEKVENAEKDQPPEEVECSRILPEDKSEEPTSIWQTMRPGQRLSTILVKPANACFDLTQSYIGNF